jgi:hypothetical protein
VPKVAQVLARFKATPELDQCTKIKEQLHKVQHELVAAAAFLRPQPDPVLGALLSQRLGARRKLLVSEHAAAEVLHGAQRPASGQSAAAGQGEARVWVHLGLLGIPWRPLARHLPVPRHGALLVVPARHACAGRCAEAATLVESLLRDAAAGPDASRGVVSHRPKRRANMRGAAWP